GHGADLSPRTPARPRHRRPRRRQFGRRAHHPSPRTSAAGRRNAGLRRLRPHRAQDPWRAHPGHRRASRPIHAIGRKPIMTDALFALSPLDGRYAAKVEALRPIFSEAGLMRHRVRVELHWLLALGDEPAIAEVPAFPADTRAALLAIDDGFSPADAERIKAIEATTNHDVKAVEYFIKERIADHAGLAAVKEFV